MPPMRDEEYYFEGGTCIFQAEDHLFKIHSFLLTRESPFFECLFTLPQIAMTSQDRIGIAGTTYEGGSDDSPIVCQDSVASFRALCWGLYMRPLEVHEQEDPANADLSRLIALGSIAHKYEFTSLEHWAVLTLQKHWMLAFGSKNTPSEPLWTLDSITQLMVFSTKTETIDQEFRKAIESQWLSSSIGSLKDTSNFRGVLDTAENFSSRRVCSLIYYHVLRHLDVCGLLSDHPNILDRPNSFSLKLNAVQYLNVGIGAEVSHHQRLKLLHGFWCLAQLRGANALGRMLTECTSHYPEEPYAQPLLSDNDTGKTKSKHECGWGWVTLCSRASNTFDFGAMIEEALHRLELGPNKFSTWDTCANCRQKLKVELQSALASFEQNLPSYFVLP